MPDPVSARSVRRETDLRVVQRAYETAEQAHGDQKRRSGDPYITHPLAVATILAELGMTPPTICAVWPPLWSISLRPLLSELSR